MRIKLINVIIPAIAFALLTSGCSLFNKGKSTSGSQNSEVVNVKNKKDSNKDSNKKDSKTLPHDRQDIVQHKPQQSYTPDEIKRGVVKGDWAIETVMGKEAIGEKAPFIKFVPSEKRIYGNNGCNVINGSYTCNPNDSTLSFSDIATTMMMCNMEGLTDYEINTALGATKFYRWRVEGTDYHLTLFNENGVPVMTLMHQNFEFLNGTWRVTKIHDTEVNVEGMKLVIDIDEEKLHGNTGCNVINGAIEVDMDRPNSISFSSIGITRMACPDSQYETSLIVALEEVSTARPVSVSEVILYDPAHKPVLTLVRTDDKE